MAFYALVYFLGTILYSMMRTFCRIRFFQNIFFKIGLSRFGEFSFFSRYCNLFTLYLNGTSCKAWTLNSHGNSFNLRFLNRAILIIISLFWGAADQHQYTLLKQRNRFRCLYDTQHPVRLPFSIQLNQIHVTKYESGNAKQVEAKFHITQNDKIYQTQCHVNAPAHFHDYDLYLQSYDTKNGEKNHYCVLMLVKDPWKKTTTTGIIFMMIAALMMMIPVKSNVTKEGGVPHD